MDFFSQFHGQENTDSLGSLFQARREKKRERQKGKIHLWTNSVSLDLQWHQDTSTAVIMHTPNSHAFPCALDVVFQVKIIGYGCT